MTNLDLVFQGLSDPTRRAVIAQLTSGPAAVSELASPHDMALPSFLKHLRVLESGGWIETEKIGRTRVCSLRVETAAIAQNWLERQSVRWERRLAQLDALLEDITHERKPDGD